MTNHGDPLFQRHVAVAGVWGLLALHLADDPILPFNYVSYTEQLWNYTNLLRNLVKGNVSLHPITASIQELASAAEEAEGEAKKLREEERNSEFLVLKKRALNDRLMLAERGFLDADGLQGRKWFKHLAEKKIATIHNVFAIIRGSEEPDRYVLLGNHRDAWTYGAVDPNSGTAVLLDIARRYALMMRQGWQPQRTIVLCSWDADEFGMIGSTEWVEQNLLNLGSKVVAYLNVDCAVQGPGFFAGATPQLDNLLIEVAKKVQDPDSESMTIYDNWMITNKVINIQRLSGVDYDFAPLLQHAGVPSVDLYYGRDFPVYHTAFDSYNWMTNHGDPLFQRHVAVAGVWGLLALHLADDPILPFNYVLHRTIMELHKSPTQLGER
eukprot:XP_019073939.1 PREDICTED: probable glutamate carboxypeptidase 2 [Vitis vinifera]